jgi:hypothetical protein
MAQHDTRQYHILVWVSDSSPSPRLVLSAPQNHLVGLVVNKTTEDVVVEIHRLYAGLDSPYGTLPCLDNQYDK